MKSLNQAAELWGVHPNTVRNWIKSNRVQFVLMGRNYKFTDEEIERVRREGVQIKEGMA